MEEQATTRRNNARSSSAGKEIARQKARGRRIVAMERNTAVRKW